MNGYSSLAVLQLLEQRCELVTRITQLTLQQQDVITLGRMSELMQILSQKQQPLSELNELTAELRHAIECEGSEWHWDDEAVRAQCRQLHELCETDLEAILRYEAECEQLLNEQRSVIAEQLQSFEKSSRAASRYTQGAYAERSGGSLDLSSGN